MYEHKAGFRDAIHVPYIMVTCDVELQPGDKISLRGDSEWVTKCVKWGGKLASTEFFDDYGKTEPMWHGVADPWREKPIPAGEVFPCMIRKECFSGMRHDFTIEVHDRGGTATCHSVCDIF